MSKFSYRPRCPYCLRALHTCICPLAQTIEHQVEVLILMHPMEVYEAKGTGHLLHLCLPHSRIMIGEAFCPAELEQALYGNWTDSTPCQSLLLYPSVPVHDNALSLTPPNASPQPWLQSPKCLRLIVIDGTWRKSRKMLHLNPVLQTLPRLALQHTGNSAYSIRKAHKPDQLSSFEATAMALAQLHNWPPDAAARAILNQVFEHFVVQQTSLRHLHQTCPKGSDEGQ